MKIYSFYPNPEIEPYASGEPEQTIGEAYLVHGALGLGRSTDKFSDLHESLCRSPLFEELQAVIGPVEMKLLELEEDPLHFKLVNDMTESEKQEVARLGRGLEELSDE